MRALLIDPSASPMATVVDVENDPVAWRSMIGEDCLQLGYMTLMTGMGEYDPAPAGDRQSLELIAVFDDHGELAGLPSFSLWSKAFGQRMTVFGRSLVVSSDESMITDAPKSRLMRQLDLQSDGDTISTSG